MTLHQQHQTNPSSAVCNHILTYTITHKKTFFTITIAFCFLIHILQLRYHTGLGGRNAEEESVYMDHNPTISPYSSSQSAQQQQLSNKIPKQKLRLINTHTRRWLSDSGIGFTEDWKNDSRFVVLDNPIDDALTRHGDSTADNTSNAHTDKDKVLPEETVGNRDADDDEIVVYEYDYTATE